MSSSPQLFAILQLINLWLCFVVKKYAHVLTADHRARCDEEGEDRERVGGNPLDRQTR